ncbi:uncharacterized protein LOC144769695 [Lissotriton helveticus]
MEVCREQECQRRRICSQLLTSAPPRVYSHESPGILLFLVWPPSLGPSTPCRVFPYCTGSGEDRGGGSCRLCRIASQARSPSAVIPCCCSIDQVHVIDNGPSEMTNTFIYWILNLKLMTLKTAI